MSEANRTWNDNQKWLKKLFLTPSNFNEAIELLIVQHSVLHPSINSYEEEIWNNTSEEDFRKIPDGSKNSIAWHMWHSARIEDITVSAFISSQPQVFEKMDYINRLRIPFKDTGNSMSPAQMKLFNSKINIKELRKYRIAVGKATIKAIKKLSPPDLKSKVSKESLKMLEAQGYVVKDSKWLLDFWGNKDIAGIIFMPLTRHLLVHINQSKRLLSRILKKK